MATNYCSRCGSPLTPNARFCPKCGAAIVAPAAAPTSGWPSLSPAAANAILSSAYNSEEERYGRASFRMEPEDHPTGAGVLTIIGGIFILLGGIAELAIGSAVSAVGLGQSGGVLVGLGALGILMGILILIFGIVILVSYENTVGYGIVVIIFSIISLASSLGGFVIGFILALIGGILAITWEPFRSTD